MVITCDSIFLAIVIISFFEYLLFVSLFSAEQRDIFRAEEPASPAPDGDSQSVSIYRPDSGLKKFIALVASERGWLCLISFIELNFILFLRSFDSIIILLSFLGSILVFA